MLIYNWFLFWIRLFFFFQMHATGLRGKNNVVGLFFFAFFFFLNEWNKVQLMPEKRAGF